MKTRERKQLEHMTSLADSHYKLVQYNKVSFFLDPTRIFTITHNYKLFKSSAIQFGNINSRLVKMNGALSV